MKTPFELGFSMPAEWAPHRATWLTWPHNKDTWPEKFELMPAVWTEMIQALHTHEKVHVLIKDSRAAARVKAKLEEAGAWSGNVILEEIVTNDSWIRDYGPIFVKRRQPGTYAATTAEPPCDGTRRDAAGHPPRSGAAGRAEGKSVAITDWIFNAWGNRWTASEHHYHAEIDDRIPQKIAKKYGYELFSPGIVMEGGSLDVNGKGTLLTTQSCLLSKTRNPNLSRAEIEKHLRDYLGITKTIWLKEGIVGDDTSGHIDDIARFTDEKTVVCIREDKRADKNYNVLKKNFGLLEKATDQDGNKLNVIALPMPRPIQGPKGVGYVESLIPASYANFYIANGVVLLPVFNQESDEKAVRILEPLFPTRKIVPIYAADLAWGLGSIHCVTQQEPS